MKTSSLAQKLAKTQRPRTNGRLVGLTVALALLALVFTFGALASVKSRSSTHEVASGSHSSNSAAFLSPQACSTNVALASYGATASASSTVNANFPASGVIDGEHNGNNWGSGGGWNDGTRSIYPDSVEVNLNVLQSLSAIDVYTLKNQPNNGSSVGDWTPATSYGITNFEVQTWNGSTWV